MNRKRADTYLIVVAVIVLVILFLFMVTANIATTFTSKTQFRISEQDSAITFAGGGSYKSAILKNNTEFRAWYFSSLSLTNSMPDFRVLCCIRSRLQRDNHIL